MGGCGLISPSHGIGIYFYFLLLLFVFLFMKTVFSCAFTCHYYRGSLYSGIDKFPPLFLLFVTRQSTGEGSMPPLCPLSYASSYYIKYRLAVSFWGLFYRMMDRRTGEFVRLGVVYLYHWCLFLFVRIYLYLLLLSCFIFVEQTGPYQKLPALKSWKSYHMASPPL